MYAFKDITPICAQMYMYILPFNKRVISTQLSCVVGSLDRQTSALWPTFAGIGLGPEVSSGAEKMLKLHGGNSNICYFHLQTLEK